MKLVMAESGETRQVTVEGRLTVENGREFRESMLSALDEGGALVLQLGGLECMDLAGMQLICSLHRSAMLRGTRLHLAPEGMPAELLEHAEASGFYPRPECGEGCLWNRREGSDE